MSMRMVTNIGAGFIPLFAGVAGNPLQAAFIIKSTPNRQLASDLLLMKQNMNTDRELSDHLGERKEILSGHIDDFSTAYEEGDDEKADATKNKIGDFVGEMQPQWFDRLVAVPKAQDEFIKGARLRHSVTEAYVVHRRFLEDALDALTRISATEVFDPLNYDPGKAPFIKLMGGINLFLSTHGPEKEDSEIVGMAIMVAHNLTHPAIKKFAALSAIELPVLYGSAPVQSGIAETRAKQAESAPQVSAESEASEQTESLLPPAAVEPDEAPQAPVQKATVPEAPVEKIIEPMPLIEWMGKVAAFFKNERKAFGGAGEFHVLDELIDHFKNRLEKDIIEGRMELADYELRGLVRVMIPLRYMPKRSGARQVAEAMRGWSEATPLINDPRVTKSEASAGDRNALLKQAAMDISAAAPHYREMLGENGLVELISLYIAAEGETKSQKSAIVAGAFADAHPELRLGTPMVNCILTYFLGIKPPNFSEDDLTALLSEYELTVQEITLSDAPQNGSEGAVDENERSELLKLYAGNFVQYSQFGQVFALAVWNFWAKNPKERPRVPRKTDSVWNITVSYQPAIYKRYRELLLQNGLATFDDAYDLAMKNVSRADEFRELHRPLFHALLEHLGNNPEHALFVELSILACKTNIKRTPGALSIANGLPKEPANQVGTDGKGQINEGVFNTPPPAIDATVIPLPVAPPKKQEAKLPPAATTASAERLAAPQAVLTSAAQDIAEYIKKLRLSDIEKRGWDIIVANAKKSQIENIIKATKACDNTCVKIFAELLWYLSAAVSDSSITKEGIVDIVEHLANLSEPSTQDQQRRASLRNIKNVLKIASLGDKAIPIARVLLKPFEFAAHETISAVFESDRVRKKLSIAMRLSASMSDPDAEYPETAVSANNDSIVDMYSDRLLSVIPEKGSVPPVSVVFFRRVMGAASAIRTGRRKSFVLMIETPEEDIHESARDFLFTLIPGATLIINSTTTNKIFVWKLSDADNYKVVTIDHEQDGDLVENRPFSPLGVDIGGEADVKYAGTGDEIKQMQKLLETAHSKTLSMLANMVGGIGQAKKVVQIICKADPKQTPHGVNDSLSHLFGTAVDETHFSPANIDKYFTQLLAAKDDKTVNSIFSVFRTITNYRTYYEYNVEDVAATYKTAGYGPHFIIQDDRIVANKALSPQPVKTGSEWKIGGRIRIMVTSDEEVLTANDTTLAAMNKAMDAKKSGCDAMLQVNRTIGISDDLLRLFFDIQPNGVIVLVKYTTGRVVLIEYRREGKSVVLVDKGTKARKIVIADITLEDKKPLLAPTPAPTPSPKPVSRPAPVPVRAPAPIQQVGIIKAPVVARVDKIAKILGTEGKMAMAHQAEMMGMPEESNTSAETFLSNIERSITGLLDTGFTDAAAAFADTGIFDVRTIQQYRDDILAFSVLVTAVIAEDEPAEESIRQIPALLPNIAVAVRKLILAELEGYELMFKQMEDKKALPQAIAKQKEIFAELSTLINQLKKMEVSLPKDFFARLPVLRGRILGFAETINETYRSFNKIYLFPRGTKLREEYEINSNASLTQIKDFCDIFGYQLIGEGSFRFTNIFNIKKLEITPLQAKAAGLVKIAKDPSGNTYELPDDKKINSSFTVNSFEEGQGVNNQNRFSDTIKAVTSMLKEIGFMDPEN